MAGMLSYFGETRKKKPNSQSRGSWAFENPEPPRGLKPAL
jgi:hypothetical protein